QAVSVVITVRRTAPMEAIDGYTAASAVLSAWDHGSVRQRRSGTDSSMAASVWTNFACLQSHDAQLVRLGMLAEQYFPEDPNTSILKLRQLTELLAQLVATHVGLYVSREEAQYDLLRRLQDQGILPREVAQLFSEVRRAGNSASHDMAGDHRTALAALKLS